MKKLFILTLIFLTCGCYNYKELNDIAITSAIGIDKDEVAREILAEFYYSEGNFKKAAPNGAALTVYSVFFLPQKKKYTKVPTDQ